MDQPLRLDDVVRQYRAGQSEFRWLEVGSSTISDAHFSKCNFDSSTFTQCHLSDTTFEDCNLSSARFPSVEFTGRIAFRGCDLSWAKFPNRSFSRVTFERCNLAGALFEEGQLANVSFADCDMSGTNFQNAFLTQVVFAGTTRLKEAVFQSAMLSRCDITPFSAMHGLKFGDGAVLDWRTICRSVRNVNLEALLVMSGMPEVFAIYSVSCAKAIDPDRLFKLMRSTFITYGASDVQFAIRLRDDLRRNGVETFFFSQDAVPGERLHDVMRRGINKYDRIVVICSAASLSRAGVRNEIQEAREREARDGGAAYLIPVALDDSIFESQDELASILRGRVVADFRDSERYSEALTSLLRALSRNVIDGA